MAWMHSVVRVRATSQDPDFDNPWQAQTPSTQEGTAVLVGPWRLLTAAHLVANAVYLEVHRIGGGEAATARVVAVDHDCDLALLEVVSTEVLDGMPVAELDDVLPDPWDEVAVVGLLSGDEGVSVVKGVVSKIDVRRYSHSQRHLLAIALDVAVGKEHGGAPAFLDGTLIGLAIQKLTDEVNRAELVPVPIIRTFLEAVRSGKPLEVPALGIATQNLENRALAAHLGLEAGARGVVVISIDRGGSSDGVLQLGDVLQAIDGMPISSNGLVDYRERHPVHYDVVLGEHRVGDRLQLDIRRAGVAQTVEVTLVGWRPLVPRARYDQGSQYLVYGGLVFQPLSRQYLTTWDEWWNTAPKEFLNFYYLGRRTAEREQVVVLTKILEDPINRGYGHLYNEGIATLNGRVPLDFVDFVLRLSRATGSVRIDTTSGGIIVLDAEQARAATIRILESYQIPRDRSSGLPT